MDVDHLDDPKFSSTTRGVSPVAKSKAGGARSHAVGDEGDS